MRTTAKEFTVEMLSANATESISIDMAGNGKYITHMVRPDGLYVFTLAQYRAPSNSQRLRGIAGGYVNVQLLASAHSRIGVGTL